MILDETDRPQEYYWIPFVDEILLKNTLTEELFKFTGKTGRLSIVLQQRANGSLNHTVFKKSVLVKQDGGEYKWVKIFRKNKEIWTDKFSFEEYDQHRGVLITDQLEKEPGVEIKVIQNGKEYNLNDGLLCLSYGLFKIVCKKNNRVTTQEFFCINGSEDITRDCKKGVYSFSSGLYNSMKGIKPLNPKFKTISDREFEENLLIEPYEECTWFINADDTIRIPIYRVSERSYVAFFNGIAECVGHNKNTSKVILYVPKDRQKDITRVNEIDSNGVRGVQLEDVQFVDSLLVNAKYDDGYFDINIPRYNSENYLFISYDSQELTIKRINPQLIAANSYRLVANRNDIIMQLVDDDNYPEIIFKFESDDGLELRTDWLLGRDAKDADACIRLPRFLYAYCVYKKWNLTKKDYNYLLQIAKEYGFDWMFLYPYEWKSLTKQNEYFGDILDTLFKYNKQQSEELDKIVDVVIGGVPQPNTSQWDKHRDSYIKSSVEYLALEYFMPICARKAKKMSQNRVNKKNADKYREEILDPKNKDIEREKSFTGNIYCCENAELFLEKLNQNESYKKIFDYLVKLKFI